jgi:hypothetical protein
VALTTFSDLVGEVRGQIAADALACGWSADPTGLEAGGSGALAYAEAVSVYLAFGVNRLCDRCSSLCGLGHRSTQKFVILLEDKPCRWFGTFVRVIPFLNPREILKMRLDGL